MGVNKKTEDRSWRNGAAAGTGAAGVGGGTMFALTGGSASAAAITHALATVGGIVGGGMAAGVGVLVGGPIIVGAGAVMATKAYNKYKAKKK